MDSANHPFVEGCKRKIEIAQLGIEQAKSRKRYALVGETREQTVKRFEAIIAVWRDALREFRIGQLKQLCL